MVFTKPQKYVFLNYVWLQINTEKEGILFVASKHIVLSFVSYISDPEKICFLGLKYSKPTYAAHITNSFNALNWITDEGLEILTPAPN